MFIDIDLNKKPLNIELSLCTPQMHTVARLKEAFNINHEIRLGNIGELNFSLPYKIDIRNEIVDNPDIAKLKQRYLIKAKIGSYEEYFIIKKITDSDDGSSASKNIQAFSLGYELKDKSIRNYKVESYNATKVLRDALSETIWSIGYIEPEMNATYRDFDVSKDTILGFVFKIATTFNAIIVWDTKLRKINFYKEDNPKVGVKKGVISYAKYLKAINKEDDADEMVTRLKVFGRNGLSIESVNPTGTDYLEDFSYFMYPFERDSNKNVTRSSYYMTDSLCSAILDYQDLVESKRGEFTAKLAELKTLQEILTTKKNELFDLETELKTIQDNLDVAKSKGLPTGTLQQQYNQKLAQVNAKRTEVTQAENNVKSKENEIAALKNLLSTENNFTPEQIEELNMFIIEGEWTDENQIIDIELYEAAKEVFEKTKNPKLIIKIDIVNFKKIIEAQLDWDKLNLGDIITIKHERSGTHVEARIVAIKYDYENDNIELTIANIKEIENDEEWMSKLLYNTNVATTTVNMSKFKLEQMEETQSWISDLVESEWDATKRMIQAGVNQSVTISERGILIKDSSDPNKFLVAQNGVLALTEDGGITWKTAIRPDGIIAEQIIGKLGMFAQVRANQIILGDNGEGFSSNLLPPPPDLTPYAPKVFYGGLMEITDNKGIVAYKDSTKKEFTQLYPSGLYRVIIDGTTEKRYEYFFERETDVMGNWGFKWYSTYPSESTIITDLNPVYTIQLSPSFRGKKFKMFVQPYLGDGNYLGYGIQSLVNLLNDHKDYTGLSRTVSETVIRMSSESGVVWDGRSETIPSEIMNTGKIRVVAYMRYGFRTREGSYTYDDYYVTALKVQYDAIV